MADLSDPAEQDRLVDAAWKWRVIDIWINNAGANVLTGEAAKWSFEEKLAALRKVDVVATLRLSRAIGQRMRERGRSALPVLHQGGLVGLITLENVGDLLVVRDALRRFGTAR